MLDYLQLILDNNINISFNKATVHIWRTDGKIASQNTAVTIKLSKTNGDKKKALHLAIDQLLAE